jgi:hypothetical protein
MTHRFVPVEEREMLGIKDNFLRMSIGLEDADDLINDIDQALKIAVFYCFKIYLIFHMINNFYLFRYLIFKVLIKFISFQLKQLFFLLNQNNQYYHLTRD